MGNIHGREQMRLNSWTNPSIKRFFFGHMGMDIKRRISIVCSFWEGMRMKTCDRQLGKDTWNPWKQDFAPMGGLATCTMVWEAARVSPTNPLVWEGIGGNIRGKR